MCQSGPHRRTLGEMVKEGRKEGREERRKEGTKEGKEAGKESLKPHKLKMCMSQIELKLSSKKSTLFIYLFIYYS